MERWTVPDLTDFEYLLAHEGQSPDASVRSRDRRIFLDAVVPLLGTATPTSRSFRRDALRIWLEERRTQLRAEQPHAVLPGEVFRESRGVLRIVIAVVGFVSGAVLALSLLTYSGKAAVNVSLYLGVLVFFQILTLLIMSRFFFFKTSLGTLRRYSLLYAGLSRALERIAERIVHTAMTRMAGEGRDGLKAAAGIMRGMYGVYGQVLFWPFFALVQLFGVMFNVGAVGATLIRVLTSDLAFGWQSTVQMSSQAVHLLVKIMSLPWAWLLGGYATPSLAQIEGSRMVLKEGLGSLATGNLVSWWPFLVAAVVCYGLLPRMLLALLAAYGEKRALERVGFSHAGCDALLLRMTSPEVSTRGVPDAPQASPQDAARAERPAASYLSYIDTVVLVPEDILTRDIQDEIDQHLGQHLGWKLTRLLPISGGAAKDRPAIQAALKDLSDDERAVVLVQEAWLPPIAETLELIREIRAVGGRPMPIALLLIGKPTPGRFLTPVRPSDRALWDKSLASLADPYLTIASAGAV
ncbi:MAG TPA: DUF2868 domain-containing protein [Deltaproteobacteria bacterium]|nr:DUF2868 domain-containing protein [Deltaproteobacteria bacterium]